MKSYSDDDTRCHNSIELERVSMRFKIWYRSSGEIFVDAKAEI